MKIFRLLFILMVVGISNVRAQDTIGLPTELDKIYIPGKNMIFSSDESTDKADNNSGFEIKNALKVNLLLFTRNVGALFYERWFTPHFSLQGGFGYCYDKDPILQTFSDIDFTVETQNVSSSVEFEDIMERGAIADGGNLFYAFSARFYFQNYYSVGNSYLEIAARNSTTNLFMIHKANSNIQFEGRPLVKVNNLNITLNFGYQFCTRGKLKTTHDFFVAGGYKRISFNGFRQRTTQVADVNGEMYEQYTHYKASFKQIGISPVILLGYSFGFGF